LLQKFQRLGKVLVSTVRSGACAACTARGMCQTVGGGGEAEVIANNAANARVGDRVVISFKTGSLLKAMFLLYLFPILCLLGGALIGNNYAYALQMDSSVSSAIIGFLSFGAAVLFVVTKGNKMAQKDEYQPKLFAFSKGGRLKVRLKSLTMINWV
jgi:sigma-E factor negative regulatory protein RseC